MNAGPSMIPVIEKGHPLIDEGKWKLALAYGDLKIPLTFFNELRSGGSQGLCLAQYGTSLDTSPFVVGYTPQDPEQWLSRSAVVESANSVNKKNISSFQKRAIGEKPRLCRIWGCLTLFTGCIRADRGALESLHCLVD